MSRFDSDHLVCLCVLRGQTDTGLTWSKPSFILGAGSAMPNLMRVGNSLMLSGGRNCNNINKTIDGCRRGADLMLWCVLTLCLRHGPSRLGIWMTRFFARRLSGDGMAHSWEMYSLTYEHNRLWLPNATVSARHGNCTQRGPNCFSVGVSCPDTASPIP